MTYSGVRGILSRAKVYGQNRICLCFSINNTKYNFKMVPLPLVALLSIHNRLFTPLCGFSERIEVRWGDLPPDHKG